MCIPFGILDTKVKVIRQGQVQISRLRFSKKWPFWGHKSFTPTSCSEYLIIHIQIEIHVAITLYQPT